MTRHLPLTRLAVALVVLAPLGACRDDPRDPRAERYDLQPAAAKKLVFQRAEVHSMERITAWLNNLGPARLIVTIRPGTVYASLEQHLPHMVVRGIKEVTLQPAGRPGDRIRVGLPAASMHMRRKVARRGQQLALQQAPASGPLGQLLKLRCFRAVRPCQDQPFLVQQYAVWTLTNNPPGGRFVGPGPDRLRGGPSPGEMARVAALLRRAKIDLSAYDAFRPPAPGKQAVPGVKVSPKRRVRRDQHVERENEAHEDPRPGQVEASGARRPRIKRWVDKHGVPHFSNAD